MTCTAPTYCHQSLILGISALHAPLGRACHCLIVSAKLLLLHRTTHSHNAQELEESRSRESDLQKNLSREDASMAELRDQVRHEASCNQQFSTALGKVSRELAGLDQRLRASENDKSSLEHRIQQMQVRCCAFLPGPCIHYYQMEYKMVSTTRMIFHNASA